MSREQEVGELTAAGMTNHEMTASLYLSARTVEQHMANVLPRLDISYAWRSPQS